MSVFGALGGLVGLGDGLTATQRDILEQARRYREEAESRQQERLIHPRYVTGTGTSAASGDNWTKIHQDMTWSPVVREVLEQLGEIQILDGSECIRIRGRNSNIQVMYSELIELIEALCRVEEKLTKAGKIS